MYQKNEIIIYKNEDLLERYNQVVDDAIAIARNDATLDQDEKNAVVHGTFGVGTKAHDYLKKAITDEEKMLCEQTDCAWNFYYEKILFYIDILKLIETFQYDNHGESETIVSFNVNREEASDYLKLVIEEFWNSEFQQNLYNPCFDDGFSSGVDYEDVPMALRMLLKQIDFHEYLQNQYAQLRDELGQAMDYNNISNYYDYIGNGEGAIAVYDHEQNKTVTYGYGRADYGWSGQVMTTDIVDRSILEQNPEKRWYPTNPMNFWHPLGPLDEEFEEQWQEDNRNYQMDIPGTWSFEEDCYEGLITYSDDTPSYTTFKMCYINNEYEESKDKVSMTGAELLEMIAQLEKMNHAFITMQKNSCERVGRDYAQYADRGFCVNMLFFSEDNEVLYAESDEKDENGAFTGNIRIHCKKF